MTSLAILVSAVLVLTCGQTDRITESHTDAAKRLTHATVVVLSSLISARNYDLSPVSTTELTARVNGPS